MKVTLISPDLQSTHFKFTPQEVRSFWFAKLTLPHLAALTPEDIEINAINPPTRFDKQPLAVSQKLYSLAVGDLNSDGMVDLAYYGDPKGLYIVLQKASDKNTDKQSELSWRTRKKIKIDDGLLTPYALVCGDLNNDGLDDLALASQDAKLLVESPVMDVDPPLHERNPVGASFSKVGDLPGKSVSRLTFNLRLRGSGVSTTEPEWLKLLKACGWQVMPLEAITIGGITSSGAA